MERSDVTPDPALKPLTPKEAAFVEEYIIDFNGTDAARRAGYKQTDAALGVTASRLLKKASVRSALKAKAEARAARLADRHMDADEWLAEATKVARATLGPFLHITADGDPYIDLSKATPDQMDMLASAEIEDFVDRRERNEDGEVVARDVRRVKIKTHDKIGGLTLVGKHLGLMIDRVKIEDAEQLAEAMFEAIAKAQMVRGGTG